MNGWMRIQWVGTKVTFRYKEEDNYQQEENDQEEVTSSSVLDDDEYTIRGNSSEADQDQALYDDSSNS
jgi:hypothetical protein